MYTVTIYDSTYNRIIIIWINLNFLSNCKSLHTLEYTNKIIIVLWFFMPIICNQIQTSIFRFYFYKIKNKLNAHNSSFLLLSDQVTSSTVSTICMGVVLQTIFATGMLVPAVCVVAEASAQAICPFRSNVLVSPWALCCITCTWSTSDLLFAWLTFVSIIFVCLRPLFLLCLPLLLNCMPLLLISLIRVPLALKICYMETWTLLISWKMAQHPQDLSISWQYDSAIMFVVDPENFFHLPYHPWDISQKRIRLLYKSYYNTPEKNRASFSNSPHPNGGFMQISDFTVVYSRPRNLCDLVLPSILKESSQFNVQSTIDSLRIQ